MRSVAHVLDRSNTAIYPFIFVGEMAKFPIPQSYSLACLAFQYSVPVIGYYYLRLVPDIVHLRSVMFSTRSASQRFINFAYF